MTGFVEYLGIVVVVAMLISCGLGLVYMWDEEF